MHRHAVEYSTYPTAELLVSYQINRQLSGWSLPSLVIRAFGPHCQERTCATTVALTVAAVRSDQQIQPGSFQTTSSTARPIARILRSVFCVPAIIMPTGAVPGTWQGTDRAQPSNRLTIAGLRSMRRLRRV